MSEITSHCNCCINKLFLESCKTDDIQKVIACVTLNVDVNFRDNEGKSALNHVCSKNSKDCLEFLLSQPDIDVNIKAKNNATPLIISCYNGYSDIAWRLCQEPTINLNCQDNYKGCTAAAMAVFWNKINCVNVLKNVDGVDWNIPTKNGNSPAMLAARKGHADILNILLSIPSIKLDWKNKAGHHITHVAVESDIGGDIKESFNENDPPVDPMRCLEILSKDKRVKWNIKNKRGEVPLITALKKKRVDVIKILLKIPEIDTNVSDKFGFTVRQIAE